jgi:AcrR family transcriptional regulator
VVGLWGFGGQSPAVARPVPAAVDTREFRLSERSSGKAKTQRRILKAATELFMEHGYGGTTITAVAERAGVGRATVFWHFSDKGSLFSEAFARLLEPFGETIALENSELSPEKRIQEQMAVSERFALEHGDEIAAFVRWALENPDHQAAVLGALIKLNQRFTEAITRSMAELVPTGSDSKLLAVALTLMFDANLLFTMFINQPRAGEERRAAIEAFIELAAQRGAREG